MSEHENIFLGKLEKNEFDSLIFWMWEGKGWIELGMNRCIGVI